jgi:formylglycine-generating enzyme required for sulfatase activity/class 3 adenylate cyclase
MDAPHCIGGPSSAGYPRQIGRYRVERFLGSGVFGAVYLARDDEMNRPVAIKVSHPELTNQPEHLAACLAEARQTAAIDHPNIVPVFEVGSTPEYPCFTVCRFIDGTSLAARMAESRLPYGESAGIVATVAGALHAAHLRNVVHGNIQPRNLLLDRHGNVFVTDFSPLLVCGPQLAGTPAYMSPEQIRGEEHRIERRSDVFSLGVVFYEMLTGRRPFAGESLAQLAEKIVAADPTPPRQIDASIPPELERVCLKMLSQRVVERYDTAQELADDLLGLHAVGSSPALPPAEQGPRVVRSTFVFTDFMGFTDRVRILEQTAGPHAAAAMKRTVGDYVEKALAQVDAGSPPTAYRLIDTAGDGFFLHFKTPEGAYRFAAALQAITAARNRQVTDPGAEHWFRTGGATGDVAWDGDKPAGNVVNVCARHQAACAGGDFLIDEATFQDLPADVRAGFGPQENIVDKNGTVHVIRRTAFGRPLVPLASVPAVHGTQHVSRVHPVVVPKGLRSFDAADSEFFLELVPGPRNLQGIPDSVRLMKSRIEARDLADTFVVGCVYGPSGCGKTSLVKAGVLPRLSPAIIAIFVEASAEDTETTLVGRLRARFPDLPSEGSLSQALMTLRRGSLIPTGGKLLIIIDQFEQWLQANGGNRDGDLAAALRQCDGTHVQCFVMVRDDFWVAVNRFMRDMDVRLVERVNAAMIDLFDVEHAIKVLASFGRAYGRLPDDPGAVSREQRQFLQEAVADLAVDGRVMPVRLALFAEIMKAKPWLRAVLKKLGGASGVCVAFLEETFGATSISARHRQHRQAARAVLTCLLPDEDTSISRRRPRSELLAASGYGKHPADFTSLIDLLDGDLRLISPIAPQDDARSADEAAGEEGAYQLAHDFLVPSLREWLTRGRKETSRGRAELLLADRATVWNRRPETRQLPSLWQSLQIRWWTRRRDWTPPQQAMMRRAALHHLTQTAIVLLALVGVGTTAWEVYGRMQAAHFRDRLLDAKIREVPVIVQQMRSFRSRLKPLLQSASRDAATQADPLRDLAIHLALLSVDESHVEPVLKHLLEAQPQDVGVIVAALEPHKEAVSQRLWHRLDDKDPRTSASRVRAAAALASYEPDSPRWEHAAESVADLMVNEEPLLLGGWVERLRPVRSALIQPLKTIFLQDPQPALRVRAASVLGDYLSDRPVELAEVLLEDFVNGSTISYAKVLPHAAEIAPIFLAEIDRAVPASADDEFRERAAKRKANAAVGLVKLGQAEQVWSLLRQSPDPRTRSYFVDRLATSGAAAATVAERLDHEPDVSARRCLLLILGSYAEDSVPEAVRQSVLPKVRGLYLNDHDPGIHGASEWLLRMWNDEAWLRESNDALRTDATPRAAVVEAAMRSADAAVPRWYVSADGQTMVVIPGPAEFTMGSPKDEDVATLNDPVHPKRIGRTYAIAAKAVSVEQFRAFNAAHTLPARFGVRSDLPAVRVDWYVAAAYCNHLSRMEGIPPEQWCYEDVSSEGRPDVRAKRNLLSLTGYRLPTEAEMEYATRAGTTTDRPYGESEELLSKYAWFAGISEGTTHPGGRLKPNDLGLFDTLGNVLEWSQNIYLPDPRDRLRAAANRDDVEDEAELYPGDAFRTLFRAQRGGSFTHSRWESRSATRTNYAVMTDSTDYMGFRLARTLHEE